MYIFMDLELFFNHHMYLTLYLALEKLFSQENKQNNLK